MDERKFDFGTNIYYIYVYFLGILDYLIIRHIITFLELEFISEFYFGARYDNLSDKQLNLIRDCTIKCQDKEGSNIIRNYIRRFWANKVMKKYKQELITK
jgi:hypothetical protein